jgi:hypothetical protein
VPQGGQFLAVCSKWKGKFVTRTRRAYTQGYCVVHAFCPDVSRGAEPKLDPHMADTQNNMLRLVRQVTKGATGIHFVIDNRFPTPRLVWHFIEMGVYVTATIRMNLFPVTTPAVKVALIPPAWSKDSISDANKAAFRLLPANMASYGPMTLTACFDTGLCKQITTYPNLNFQDATVIENQRRVFAELKSKVKLATPHLYTSHYNGVDVVDHNTVMNQMALHSFKWTWNPTLRVIEFAKNNAYASHVALCEDYNERNGFTNPKDDPMYLAPMKAKEFYRKWGLMGMRYKAANGYWFETATGSAAAAGVAAPAGPAAAAPRLNDPTSTARAANKDHRFDRQFIHTQDFTYKPSGPLRCKYCGVETCRTKCQCGVVLHFPTGGGGGIQWPCAHRYHSREYSQFCWADTKPPKAKKHRRDPDIDTLRENSAKYREQKPASQNGSRTIATDEVFSETTRTSRRASREAAEQAEEHTERRRSRD